MKRFLIPVVAFASGLVAISLILAFSTGNPILAIQSFFTRPFSSWWYIGNTLNMAGLLVFASVGSSLALRGGTFNLGGEAQIYASALVTAVILSGSHVSAAASGTMQTVALFTAALAAAAFTGALLAFIPGILKALINCSELLASFLLSAAVVPVVDYLIAGPFRDQTGNLIATEAIGKAFRLAPLFKPSFFNVSFFIAVALALLANLALKKTRKGYRYGVSGIAPDFARFAGYSVGSVTVASMTLSGLFHGLTGFFAITGTWYMCHQSLTAGMGWSALAVALIARSNPVAVIPAAILYSWLATASDMAFLSSNSGFDSTSIVQAIILLVVSARFIPAWRAKK
jgi:simple sugar transport system permease protein